MKSLFSMYALTAIAMSASNGNDIYDTPKSNTKNNPKETDEERKKRLENAEIERYKSQGLKEFFYGKNSLWALNQKSADKKALKKNWL